MSKSLPSAFTANPSSAIAAYFTANIRPWHDAARQAIQTFNQHNPDKKLREQDCEKVSDLRFTSKNSEQKIELKIKQQQHLDAFRVKLEGPDLHKEHTSLTPETFATAIYHMLSNHVAQKN